MRLISVCLIGLLLAGCSIVIETRQDSSRGDLEGWVYSSVKKHVSPNSLDSEKIIAEDDVHILASPQNSGNYVPFSNADVLLVHQERDFTRKMSTSSNGYFQFSNIPVGAVKVIIDHRSFPAPIERRDTIVGNTTSTVSDVRAGVGYYLLVGIDQYEYYNFEPGNAKTAKNDLNLMKKVLADENAMTSSVVTLYDRDATKENIENKLQEILINSNPEDFIVFYFSGHADEELWETGVNVPSLDHIVPYDGWNDASIITDGELLKWIEPWHKGQDITLILDCNYSGSFVDGHVSLVNPQAFLHKPYTVLAAAEWYEEAFASESGQFSYFTSYLAEGIRELRQSKPDKVVTVYELFEYVKSKMEYDRKSHGREKTSLPVLYSNVNTVISRGK